MKKSTVAILEGDYIEDSIYPNEYLFEDFSDIANLVQIGDYLNLYNWPEKLDKLITDDPDYIFFNTNFFYKNKIDKLVEKFVNLEYVPKNVIFGPNVKEDTFKDLIISYERKGTVFYKIDEEELETIKLTREKIE
jgi:hypothetical protein